MISLSKLLYFSLLLSFTNSLISMDRVLSAEQAKVDKGVEAAEKGDLETLKLFINSSNVNALSTSQRSPLSSALKFAFESKDESKYVPLLEYLFSQNTQIQNPIGHAILSPFGFAIAKACKENYIRPVELLLSKGAQAFSYCTPSNAFPAHAVNLCFAAKKEGMSGANAVLKLLQPQARNLTEAIECFCPEKVKQFANQTTLEALHKEGQNPLVSIYNFYEFGIEEAFPLFGILLSQGAHPHQELSEYPMPGFTFMLLATQHAVVTGDMKLIELCIAHGGHPEYKVSSDRHSAKELVEILSYTHDDTHVPQINALFNERERDLSTA